jgi:exo-beta-1,3-glucanase (GH17 family)
MRMHKAVSLFTFTAAIIVTAWWWLGMEIEMPPSPLGPGEKLHCVSYSPFRGRQTPLDRSTRIEPRQIEQDLAQLSHVSDCVRTYSVDFGLDRIPEIAQRHGLKVLLGLWVSSHIDRTQFQIDTGVALARRYPDVVRAVIVGNEALLRGEISPGALRDLIVSVKLQITAPVTYADVWEFWLRHRELADAVDFVTVHILPYWEDDPIPAHTAASHVGSIRRRVAASFPGQEVMIGEVGWPSAGRMRAGALPSPANQARVVQDVLARGKSENFRVNVIEAFDQPWKRFLEGTVGGHWGLFDDVSRQRKFEWGAAISNRPAWAWQAATGVALAALVFAAGLLARQLNPMAANPGAVRWIAIAANAAVGGIFAGWTIENVLFESLGIGGWLRSLAYALVSLATPIAGAAALMAQTACPAFAHVIGPKADRVRDRLALALGLLLMVLTALALQSALGLAFDPRYRDFPIAPLTAACVPFMLIAAAVPRQKGVRPAAEIVAATVLGVCAVYIVWNETLANWQALWFSTTLVALAISLVRARAAPG